MSDANVNHLQAEIAMYCRNERKDEMKHIISVMQSDSLLRGLSLMIKLFINFGLLHYQ